MTELHKKVILTYAKNNMSYSATARELYLHRNTVVYHIQNIKEKYGLDPANFFELKRLVDMTTGSKCSFGNVTIKPDGVNELDPCVYQVVEKYCNVTIEILRCKKCGNTEISWHRQEDTEDITDLGEDE